VVVVREGALGFKCFMAPSGVDEFQHVGEADLLAALPVLARLDLPLLVHAELPAGLVAVDPGMNPRDYRTWLMSRPPASEHAAIELLIRLARDSGVHIHVVHLASADAIETIRSARRAGVRITVETCPHYLRFDAGGILEGATAYKCAPPIRESRHREGLWAGLAASDIDLVATDHSPAPPALKSTEAGDFVAAWGGIASIQLGLRAVWTGASGRGLPLDLVMRWLAAAPARLAGLTGRKGAIALGHDADLVFFDPDAVVAVDPASLFHRHPITPYAGMPLRGVVHKTLLRGEIVFGEGEFPVIGHGRPVLGEREKGKGKRENS
jgi:allantoinase